jgi:hypothetical protein
VFCEAGFSQENNIDRGAKLQYQITSIPNKAHAYVLQKIGQQQIFYFTMLGDFATKE